MKLMLMKFEVETVKQAIFAEKYNLRLVNERKYAVKRSFICCKTFLPMNS